MSAERERALSTHFKLQDFLVDETFPDLALILDPSPDIIANLERLTALIDRIVNQFPPAWRVLSGYRDVRLNEACRGAGLPASVDSAHLYGCAADIQPVSEGIELESVFEWLRDGSRRDLPIHEAVYYPLKGFIHVSVENNQRPTPKRMLMRT